MHSTITSIYPSDSPGEKKEKLLRLLTCIAPNQRLVCNLLSRKDGADKYAYAFGIVKHVTPTAAAIDKWESSDDLLLPPELDATTVEMLLAPDEVVQVVFTPNLPCTTPVSGFNNDIDFHGNREALNTIYAQEMEQLDASVKEMVGGFVPGHRVGLDVLRSISECGFLNSLCELEVVKQDPERFLHTTLESEPRIVLAAVRNASARKCTNDPQATNALIKYTRCYATLLARSELMFAELSEEEAEELKRLSHRLFKEPEPSHGLLTWFTSVTIALRSFVGLPSMPPGWTASLSSLAVSIESFKALMTATGGTNNAELDAFLDSMDATLERTFDEAKSLKELKVMLDAVVKAKAERVRRLLDNSPGCSCDKDVTLETNKQIFSIIGPNSGSDNLYGSVCLLLDEDIMCHPDFNMTPAAGTSILSGRAVTRYCHSALKEAPFNVKWTTGGKGCEGNRKAFHMSKMTPALCGWRLIYASSLANSAMNRMKAESSDSGSSGWGFAATAAGAVVFGAPVVASAAVRWLMGANKAPEAKISCKDVMEHYQIMTDSDSHGLIEGHLPSTIPLSRVARILILENDFSDLSEGHIRQLELTTGKHRNSLFTRLKDNRAMIMESFQHMKKVQATRNGKERLGWLAPFPPTGSIDTQDTGDWKLRLIPATVAKNFVIKGAITFSCGCTAEACGTIAVLGADNSRLAMFSIDSNNDIRCESAVGSESPQVVTLPFDGVAARIGVRFKFTFCAAAQSLEMRCWPLHNEDGDATATVGLVVPSRPTVARIGNRGGDVLFSDVATSPVKN